MTSSQSDETGRPRRVTSSNNEKTVKQLLEQLYVDKKYLESILSESGLRLSLFLINLSPLLRLNQLQKLMFKTRFKAKKTESVRCEGEMKFRL